MPTTTRVLLLQRLSEALGDWWSQLTTGAGITTTVVDSKLAQLSGGDDDFCIRWYIRKPAGAAGQEVRQITAYVDSTTTITHVAFATPVGDATTYELHRYHPDDKHAAIARAIEELYPHLYLPIRDETLVVDNLLSNSDFESALSNGVHPSWTNSGSPTVTAETSILMHGAQASKIVAGGSAGSHYQDLTINIKQLTDRAIRFKAWVYATAANIARIRLDWDGTNITSSSYHNGRDEWQLLEVATTVPSTATRVRCICECAANGTGYFDATWCAVLPDYRYTVPTSILTGPHYVSQQAHEYDPDGVYLPLGRAIQGRRLRLEGMGLLTTPTTDSGTTEVGAPRSDLIVAQAARNLMRIMVNRSATEARERYLADMQMWEQEVLRLLQKPGIRMPAMGANVAKGIWHSEEDSSGRYLLLDRRR